jgi:hypothetical protein
MFRAILVLWSPETINLPDRYRTSIRLYKTIGIPAIKTGQWAVMYSRGSYLDAT